jgi:hypothetical protein
MGLDMKPTRDSVVTGHSWSQDQIMALKYYIWLKENVTTVTCMKSNKVKF